MTVTLAALAGQSVVDAEDGPVGRETPEFDQVAIADVAEAVAAEDDVLGPYDAGPTPSLRLRDGHSLPILAKTIGIRCGGIPINAVRNISCLTLRCSKRNNSCRVFSSLASTYLLLSWHTTNSASILQHLAIVQELVTGHRLNFGGGCRGCGKATAGGSRPWGGVDIRGMVDDEVAGGRGGRALPDPFTTGAKPEMGGGRGGSALSAAITMGKEDEVDGGRRGSALSVSFTAEEKGEVGGGVGGGQSWNDL
ncbi:hypothetical protein ACEPPN_019478 [Leptodophora sp. 'Broadleaf-Isolate-01']